MARRAGSVRRRRRETAWVDLGAPTSPPPEPGQPIETILLGLPPALRAVAVLVLTGHNRREIAYLLHLNDAALRQRIAQLRAKIATAGISLSGGMPGLNLDLAYGRIRDALLPLLVRQAGDLASHDPDGHLFVLRRSQKP